MKSSAKGFIVLGLGIIFLTLAISVNQFEIIQQIIDEFTSSAIAGIPTP